jgi:uncharacterized ion transporter superfamily protein YfcC
MSNFLIVLQKRSYCIIIFKIKAQIFVKAYISLSIVYVEMYKKSIEKNREQSLGMRSKAQVIRRNTHNNERPTLVPMVETCVFLLLVHTYMHSNKRAVPSLDISTKRKNQ